MNNVFIMDDISLLRIKRKNIRQLPDQPSFTTNDIIYASFPLTNKIYSEVQQYVENVFKFSIICLNGRFALLQNAYSTRSKQIGNSASMQIIKLLTLPSRCHAYGKCNKFSHPDSAIRTKILRCSSYLFLNLIFLQRNEELIVCTTVQTFKYKRYRGLKRTYSSPFCQEKQNQEEIF